MTAYSSLRALLFPFSVDLPSKHVHDNVDDKTVDDGGPRGDADEGEGVESPPPNLI